MDFLCKHRLQTPVVKVNRLPNRVAPNILQQTYVRYTILNIHENEKWARQTPVTISNSIVIVRIWTIKGYDNKLEKNRMNMVILLRLRR